MAVIFIWIKTIHAIRFFLHYKQGFLDPRESDKFDSKIFSEGLKESAVIAKVIE